MKLANALMPLTVVLTVAGLSACGSDTESTPANVTTDVALSFKALVDNSLFVCGNTYNAVGNGNGGAGHDYQPTDFRFFIHDVHLHDHHNNVTYNVALTQDGKWQQANVALLDFEDGCGAFGNSDINTEVVGTIEAPADLNMAHTDACFTVGVPADLNHLDPAAAASPLNDVNMHWAWKVGYKYVRIDATGDPSGTGIGYNLHLGAQGDCGTGTATETPTNGACTIQNTFEVCIADFDQVSEAISVDPVSVFEANDISVNNGMAAGCQSFAGDEDCVEVMPRLGLDYSYSTTTVGASSYTGGQKLFGRTFK